MAGFLDDFRKKIVSSVWKEEGEKQSVRNIDDKIALGVLLWIVAEADGKFLEEEKDKIKEVLVSYSKINQNDLAAVLASVEQAAKERIDLYRFTHEVSDNLPYAVKVSIVENLFRVACVDKELDNREMEAIRKISGLFKIAHKDFINTKIKIKKEFGISTV